MSEQRTLPDGITEDMNLKIEQLYSFNGGLKKLKEEYREEFEEVVKIIESNTAEEVFVKESAESMYSDIFLASPGVMNHNILVEGLKPKGWAIDHSAGRNKNEIKQIGKEPRSINDEECKVDIESESRWGKRTADAVKNGIILESQFGKYAFMVYDVLAKFAHFKAEDEINLGIELVPSNELYRTMSSGVGYFEQIRADLEHLPKNYISDENKIPTIVIGIGFKGESIDLDNLEEKPKRVKQKSLD